MRIGSLALLGALVAATIGLAAPPLHADSYPSRPVQLIVAYSAGGTGDVVARTISDALSRALGQSVVVENRPGASGAIAAQSVARAAPDGYTILVGQTGEIAINQHLMKGLGYDPDRDLEPIALGADVPLALVVPASAPYKSLPELLAASRTKKEGLTFASAGIGTPGYFAGELLRTKTGANLVHVPYKGAAPALNDLIGGHVDMYFPGFPPSMPLIKSGQVKVLALSSARRSAVAPDIPTVAEVTGIEDFDLTLWVGFFAPHGTPEEIVARLNREINAVITRPDIKDKLRAAGADVRPMSVEEVKAFVKAQSAKYEGIIKETGAKID